MAVRQFTTDEDGRLPSGLHLLPNRIYRLQPKPRPIEQRLDSVEALIQWIQECVLGDLRTLLAGMKYASQADAAERLGGGNFLLVSGCMMALEYVATIYSSSDDATVAVEEYLGDFLAPINPRYQEACGLLWRAMRNGMIHHSWPLRVSDGHQPTLRFTIGNDMQDAHLVLERDADGPLIAISGPRLLEDLEASVDNWVIWLRGPNGPAALNRAQAQLMVVSSDDRIGRGEFARLLKWASSI